MNIKSKLPQVGTTIFTVMSKLAQETKAVNLSQGFPDFDCDKALKKLVNKYIKEGKNQYAPMQGVLELRQAIAQKVNSSYNINIQESDVTVTAGATQAIYNAITSIIRPGDEVVLIEPAYDCYKPTVQLCGGIARSYELNAPNYEIDWSSFARLITSKTRLIIINNPHNPLGKTLKKEDLESLQKLVSGTDIIILSDEVYEHIIFDNQEHWSVLRFPELQKRSFVTFSFGKTFHTTGWKMGYCIAPDFLTKEFLKVHQFNVFSVNTPTQYALAEYLQEEEHYNNLGSFFQEKRDYFLENLSQSKFIPIPSEGTYFQLLDYSNISDLPDVEFAKMLTRKHHVAVIPISVFYSSKKDDKIVRVCFAKTKKTLKEASTFLSKV